MNADTRLLAPANPVFRIRKRFTRYLVVVSCTGVISFVAALFLLHRNFSPFVSLTLSSLFSGLLSYTALELWGFPLRRGRLSWKRLTASSLVGVAGFAARVGVLSLGLRLFHFAAPLDKAAPLALAYGTSFLVGYLLRSRVVFRHHASSRRRASSRSSQKSS